MSECNHDALIDTLVALAMIRPETLLDLLSVDKEAMLRVMPLPTEGVQDYRCPKCETVVSLNICGFAEVRKRIEKRKAEMNAEMMDFFQRIGVPNE